MKASELRIGNCVNEGVITLSDFYNMHLDGNCPFTPIPLTEEWLVKFGFESKNKESDTEKNWTFKGLRISLNSFNGLGFKINCHGILLNVKIIHVHQFQNLYYALTQKELCLNT